MNALDALAKELAENVTEEVLNEIRREVRAVVKSSIQFCYTEGEAAEILGMDAQSLARLRKRGEIDHTYSIAPTKWRPDGRPLNGRPAYMPHHLLDYLKRHEVVNGKQSVTLADVLNFAPRLKAA